MPRLSNDVAVAFQELFYGEGMWLGVLLVLAIVTGLTLKNKYATVLCLPVTVFLGIDYLQNGTGNQLWGAMIMFVASIFLVVQLMRERT